MTDSTSTRLQTLENRVKAAATVMKITEEVLWTYLALLGIDRDEDGLTFLEADTTQEGDARRVMVEDGAKSSLEPPPAWSMPLVKIARFKAGWAILKGKSNASVTETSDVTKLIDAMRPVKQWSDLELVAAYNPDCSHEIVDELKRRSNGHRFVIFNDDKVVIETTLELLRIARHRETPQTYTDQKNNPYRVYNVGEFPMLYADECPCHRDILLANDYCEKCQFSWKGVQQDARIGTRIAVDMNLLPTNNIMVLHEQLNKIISKGMFDTFPPLFKIKYNELSTESALPRLRRKLSKTGQSDPFFVHKQW